MDHRTFRVPIALAALLLAGAGGVVAANADILFDASSERERFAVQDLSAALRARRFAVRTADAKDGVHRPRDGEVRIEFFPLGESAMGGDPDGGFASIHAEGFAIRHVKAGGVDYLRILSIDDAGAMYGGLELAEQIRTRGLDGVTDTDRNPYMARRGTKLNAPLDLRTPSYTDMSDSAQENIATMWDFDFWRAYLDQLARDRYNYVSLWNLHPFPSLVKVPEYPDIALDDVWRSKIRFAENYDTNATGLVTREMLAHKVVLKHLTIEQKMEFWRRVMAYARDRNITFYLITWNVFTYGTDGKYGITDALDNPRTVDYFRASVRALLEAYPLLGGIGLTTGENMGDASFEAKEQWAFATYGQGVLDAANADPARHFTLIHRQHQTRAADIAATFQPVIARPNVEFLFSFKYAQAHVYSSTVQSFHREFLQSLGDRKTLWTLRNDDALLFRAAAPDFVREFVKNIPYENSAGYYYGSDMWVWGREFLDKHPRTPRQLEIDKHWLPFLLWGRMAYDPTLDDALIAAIVGQRFPGVDGARLLAAWQHASMTYPLVTGFHWADFDFQWYIEACRSRPGPARTASGFHSVETFIDQPVHPATDNVPIPVYVAALLRHDPIPKGTTPPQLADTIDSHADAALASLGTSMRDARVRADREYASTLEDIRAMALLGKYYAAKIRGATSLAMYRASRDAADQRDAVEQLTTALRVWKEYSARTAARYRNPLWTNRVGYVDWKELDGEVAHDIDIARAPLR